MVTSKLSPVETKREVISELIDTKKLKKEQKENKIILKSKRTENKMKMMNITK